jgi:hypothetical protein
MCGCKTGKGCRQAALLGESIERYRAAPEFQTAIGASPKAKGRAGSR